MFKTIIAAIGLAIAMTAAAPTAAITSTPTLGSADCCKMACCKTCQGPETCCCGGACCK